MSDATGSPDLIEALLTTLRALPESAYKADHPASVLRRALPADADVYGWWTPTYVFPWEEDPWDRGQCDVAGVAWRTQQGFACLLVSGDPEDLWPHADLIERRTRLLAGVMSAFVHPTIEDLIAEYTPDTDLAWASNLGALVWGLQRLVPEARREAVRLLVLLQCPGFGAYLQGDEHRGVWSEPPA